MKKRSWYVDLAFTAICLTATVASARERKAWQMPPDVLIWARLSAQHVAEAGVTLHVPMTIDKGTPAADLARAMRRQAPVPGYPPDGPHGPQTGSPQSCDLAP